MNRLRFRWFAAAAGAALSAVAVGCSSEPPLGAAAGRVTFRGAPVGEGSVVFADEAQGASYVTDLGADGGFAFQVARGEGLPPGTYAVAIRPPRPNKPALGYVPPNYKKTDYSNIPKKYHDAKTSGLTATVKGGDGTPFEFDMK